jgi:8-oxo-dGTP pyrophosphatase MutT (NUDIX family)
MTEYKAAAIVYYRYLYVDRLKKTFTQVYLHYEHKYCAWSHFGGKKEPNDLNAWETALRELQEESNIATLPIPLDVFCNYYKKSKMVVYYILVNDIKTSGAWMDINCLPNNIRAHIKEQFRILKC